MNLWAANFLTWIVAEGFFGEVRPTVSGTFITEEFPQIAYGLGSSFKGIAHLSAITGNSNYGALASKTLDLFAGKNRAKTKMYDPETGRYFDGINDPSNVNRNSTAESTIEALSAQHYNYIKPSSR